MESKIYIPNKVKIRGEEKVYQQGEIIQGIPDEDMEYLIRNRFIKAVGDIPDHVKDQTEANFGLEHDDASDNALEFFTEEQLKKLPSKAAVISYAESIGLPGLDDKLHKPELIDTVLAYIEEMQNDVL